MLFRSDRIFEGNETFSVILTNAENAALTRFIATGTILDDDFGEHHHYDISLSTNRAAPGEPIRASIVAKSATNGVVPSFNGRVKLAAILGARTFDTGAGGSAWGLPMGAYFHDAKSQTLYPATRLGGGGAISAISLRVKSLPGQTLEHWTIRLAHSVQTDFANGQWLGEPWTDVHQSDAVVTDVGWARFPFRQPFHYDGRRNLAVDFSFNNSDYTFDGQCYFSETDGLATLCLQTDSAFGDPLDRKSTRLNSSHSSVSRMPSSA